MDNMAYAMLLAFGGMTGFLALAGVLEYVVFPVWDRVKKYIPAIKTRPAGGNQTGRNMNNIQI